MPDSLQLYGLEPTRFFCPWDFPGKNTGVGCQPLISTTFQNVYIGLPWLLSGKESGCQCDGHEFEPWSGKIPHALGQLNHCPTLQRWACILEPGSSNHWGHVPQLLKLCALEPMLCTKRSPPWWEAHALQLESSPCLLHLEKALTWMKTQHSQK